MEEETGKESGGSGHAHSAYDIVFWVAVILIIGVTIYYRVPMLQFYGFYEPDGFFHYSVIMQAISNHFAIPQVNPLTGWPKPPIPQPHHEPFGLYWSTIIPYALLQFFGLTAYDVARLVPVLFGVLDVIGAYYLARYLSRDRLFGLLVMLFVALNMGNAARTSALIYRGDTFVSTFFIFALIATIEAFRTQDKKRKLLMMFVSAFLLSLCNLVWNGAAFATATYIFAFGLMLLLGFTFEDKKLVNDSKYMLGSLAIWFFLVLVYKALEWIVSVEAFTGLNFFLLFVPMAVGWYIVDQIVHTREAPPADIKTPLRRFVLASGVTLAVFLLIYIIIPSFVSEIFVTNGFLIVNNFSSTIQELQSPSYSFLYASFGYQSYLNPMGAVMLVSACVGSTGACSDNIMINMAGGAVSWVVQKAGAKQFSIATIPLWILLLLLTIPYLFLKVENDGDGFISGNSKWRFGLSEVMILLISYLALTAYLQMHAIRFNSLISIPLSIFGAYTVYWLILFFKTQSFSARSSFDSFGIVLFGVFAILFAAETYGQPSTFTYGWTYATIPLALVLASIINAPLGKVKRDGVAIFSSAIFALFALIVSYYSIAELQQNIGLWAVALVAAAFLAFFFDWFVKNFNRGSSIMYLVGFGMIALQMGAVFFDMLSGEIGLLGVIALSIPFVIATYLLMGKNKGHEFVYYISYFLLFLLIANLFFIDVIYITGLSQADQINPLFINALAWMRNNTPSNSVVLTLWPDGSLVEGIANRVSVTDSVGSQYSAQAGPFAKWLFNSSPDPQFLLGNLSGKPDYLLARNAWLVETGGIFTEAELNSTAPGYGYATFTNLKENVTPSGQVVYDFYGSTLHSQMVITNKNNTKSIQSYLVMGANQIQPFKYIVFYNQQTGNFSRIEQTAFNVTNGETFFIEYSGVPSTTIPVNVTAAYLFNAGLAEGNMIKLIYECNSRYCIWSNNIAKLELVYLNSDTRIFKIIYNESNPLVTASNYPR